MACPHTQTVADFVAGRLDPRNRREMEAHVDACESCHQVVARILSGMPEPQSGVDQAVSITVEPVNVPDAAVSEGNKIGRYIVLGRVGAGGMGTVYAAYDTALDRKIALKFLSHTRSTETAQAQVLAEASAMAKLAHPNVVTVHDVGVFEGRPYLAMEFVDGTTLSAWRRQQPRRTGEITRVMAGAARGLAALHAAGIVHRDVKPLNILVSGARVLVTDFGLSVRDQGPETPGVIAGTPAYMAPEQLRGERVDARADVFGFCATLYEMLHGVAPFTGGSLARAVSVEVPGPPPGSKVPARLHRLAARGLAPDPADRPSDLNAIADELLKDPGAARRRAVIAAAAVAFGVAAFWGGGYLRASPERRCRAGAEVMATTWNDGRRAELRQRYQSAGLAASWPIVERRFDDYDRGWRAMHGETCAATFSARQQSEVVLDLRMDCLNSQRATVGALAAALATAKPAQLEKAVSLRVPAVHECDAAGRGATRPLPADPGARAEITRVEGILAEAEARRLLSEFDLAEQANKRALEAARKVGYEPLLARALQQVAAVETWRGNASGPAGDRAAALLGEVLALAEASRDDTRRAAAMSDLVMVNIFRDRYADAEVWAGVASAVLAKAGDPPHFRAHLENAVGWLKYSKGDLAQAGAAFTRAYQLRRQIFRPTNPLVVGVHHGMCITRPTNLERIACFREHVPMSEAAYGARSSDTAAAYNSLGIELMAFPRWLGEACPLIRKAVEIKEASLDPSNPTLVDDYNNLALCLSYEGKLTEARALYEKGLGRATAKSGSRARLLAGHGVTLATLGEADRGLQQIREGLALRRELLGPAHYLTMSTTAELGRILVNLGRAAEALAESEQAIEACAKAKAKPTTLVDLHNLRGRALHALGRHQPALEAHQGALRLYEELSKSGGAAVTGRRSDLPQSAALHGAGVAELALGRRETALATLEKALVLRVAGEVMPELRAETLLALARAAGREPAAAGRGCALGREAVTLLRGGGERTRRELDEAERWLAAQRCPTS